MYPFSSEAKCSWTEVGRDGTPGARFEIAEITDTGIEELEKALQAIAFLE